MVACALLLGVAGGSLASTSDTFQLAVFPYEVKALLRINLTEAQLTSTLSLSCAVMTTGAGGQPPGTVIWSMSGIEPVPNASTGFVEIWVEPEQRPQPWSLTFPRLYNVSCERNLGEMTWGPPPRPVVVRFGFREFEAKNGQFLLNGKPIFLRGNSINPPGRELPSALSSSYGFARDYLKQMKRGFHVNAVRIGDGCAADNVHWYDAADEIGILIYAGPYSSPRCPGCGGKPASGPPPPHAADMAFEDYQSVLMGGTSSHPSHVIFILSNEVCARTMLVACKMHVGMGVQESLLSAAKKMNDEG